jgi:chondroitin-sulfate-ABC endolyase/exolyase
VSYQKQLKAMFMQLYLHAEEQGIAAGSGLGTIHHSGYSFRNYYPALYLMKEVLTENGKLKDAMQSMQWYAATGEVLLKPEMPGMDMDAFNTTALGRLASILMMNDSPEKMVYLHSFVRWLDNGLLPSPGLMGAFKIDGAVMHHCNNYPAYGIGGIGGASLLTWLFSGTDFHVSENGHANLKKAMQTMRFYCNTEEWAVSISGRHPKGTEKLIPLYYAYMALSGTPDGQQRIDEEMARTYLRLTDYDDQPSKYRKYLLEEGFTPEVTPQGNLTVNYGCLTVHRRAQWMATAHGFSRYLWAAEHYIGANYYGRYLSHGSLFIQTGSPESLITNATGGYQQQGWDWNSIPGTTATHLPLDLLKANILNVDTCSGYEEMLHSDEAFAGGISQEQKNGVFAMKLHEHDKYNGSLRAKKSIFFFDDKIVCLGSDIENKSAEYPTRTTLYQNVLNNLTDSLISTEDFLMDNVHTGYYIPKGQSIRLSKKRQHSRDQALDTPTEGLFATAWIEHGNAPSGAGYEYAVFPETTPEKMQSVVRQMSNKETALYEVIRKDEGAHIVKDKATRTMAYVLFEPNQWIEEGIVEKVDTACLVMLKATPSGYLLTVADPDLRLYEGASDDVYDETGKRIERSIYSRSWITNESTPSVIQITLRGKWNIRETAYCHIVQSDNKQTILSFNCQDGLSREIMLLQ